MDRWGALERGLTSNNYCESDANHFEVLELKFGGLDGR